MLKKSLFAPFAALVLNHNQSHDQVIFPISGNVLEKENKIETELHQARNSTNWSNEDFPDLPMLLRSGIIVTVIFLDPALAIGINSETTTFLLCLHQDHVQDPSLHHKALSMLFNQITLKILKFGLNSLNFLNQKKSKSLSHYVIMYNTDMTTAIHPTSWYQDNKLRF